MVDDYPFAGVYSIADLTVPTSASETIPLDAGYSFKATDTAEEAEASKYAKYHVDFVVSADTDIPAGALTLAGQYESWSQYWLAFTNEKAVPAGDKIRLLHSAGVTMNYEERCELVKVFSCGLKSDVLDGTTVKVELTLFEVEEASEENNNSWNVETGESITIGTYTYTFGAADEETPRATVTELKGEALEVNVASNWSNMNTTTPIALDAGYTFATTETYDEAKDSKFAEWHADFVVTSDKALAANTLTLAGQYNAWSANWLAITNPADVAANGSIRLLGSANLYMSYAELCRDVQNFNCGLAEVTDGALTGTTITVELRLFETVGGNETGKYEVVGTYKYTF